jgi:hypothetical protein
MTIPLGSGVMIAKRNALCSRPTDSRRQDMTKVVIGKKMRVLIGLSLVATAVTLATAPQAALNVQAAAAFWLGVLFLIWSTWEGPFWWPTLKQAAVLLRRILIVAIFFAGATLSLIFAITDQDPTQRVVLRALCVVFGLSGLGYGVWMIYLWGKGLASRLANQRPIAATPGGERLRIILFWFRVLLAGLLVSTGIEQLIFGMTLLGVVLLVLGLLSSFGAYRTRKKIAAA